MPLGIFSQARAQAGSVALALVLLAALPVQAETLTEVYVTTLQSHPALKADRAATQAAEEAISTVRSGFFPTFSVNSELNGNNISRDAGPATLFGRTGTLQAQQLIFDGFRTAKQVDAAEADRSAVRADYLTNANGVLFTAVRAYINVVRERELLEATQRFLNEHTKSIVRVTEMITHDPGKQFDLVQLQMRASMASSFITEREGALKVSESQFLETVGHAPGKLDTPARLAEPGFKSLEDAMAVAERSHPALVAAGQRLLKRQAEREQASGVLMPRFDATARYTKGWDRLTISGSNDEAYAGVLASYALSSGGSQLAAIRNAEQLELSSLERLNAAKRDVREAVRVAWAQREALGNTLPLANDYLKKANEVVSGYEAQFFIGRRSVLELLLIRNEIYSSETRLIGLKYDQLLADYALATQMGVLQKQFPDVPTGVAPVDPPSVTPTQKPVLETPSTPPKSP